MRQLSGVVGARGFAFVVLGTVSAAALMFLSTPGYSVEQTVVPETITSTPAQVIAHRFPPNWGPMSSPRPAGREETKQAIATTFFNPNPTFALASASSTSIPSGLPERVVAYADPNSDHEIEAPRPSVRPPAEKVEKTEKKPVAVRPPAKQSNAVFNDAQIASIKTRLKLTPYQERMWPSVEAALRNISYKKDGGRNGSRMATVDPNSPGVQQLKSAAFPMIMSFSAEQKNEVRQLARLMGLEQVASSF